MACGGWERTGIVEQRQQERLQWGRYAYRVEPYGPDPLAELKAAARIALAEKQQREREDRQALITLRQNVTRGLVAEALGPHTLTIIKAVCEATGYTKGALIGPSRRHPLVIARMMTYWLIRSIRQDLSLPSIGKAMGYRDHSTIKTGITRFEKLKLTPPVFQWLEHPAILALSEKQP